MLSGGPASGKTQFCLHACNSADKPCYIDTFGLSGELKKINDPKSLIVYRVKSFVEQEQAIERACRGNYDLIVLDSLTGLYRRELTQNNYKSLNNSLVEQISLLSEYARLNDAAVLITTQMSGKNPLGGELLEYIPIHLHLTSGKIIVKKCPLNRTGEARFKITAAGLE